MSKLESYGTGLLPIAVVAGLLSGTLFKQNQSGEASKPVPTPQEATRRTEVTSPVAWISDLRPVMETMGDAMGLALQRDVANRTAGVTAEQFDQIAPAEVTTSIVVVQSALHRLLSNDANACHEDAPDSALVKAERTLNAYLLSDPKSDSPAAKVRLSVAEAVLTELHDWRALTTLARPMRGPTQRVTYDVKFIVATIPDYVDSHAGWFADHSLAAIQSAMSRSDFLLDRFRLVDWTRSDPRSDDPVASDSRLHERQPGALIFRRDDGPTIRIEVVLLALETPTSGVHRPALRNAIRFVRAWNRCTEGSGPPAELRVLGPTFSGSSLSLALTIGDQRDDFAAVFPTIRVISGSATADTNPAVIKEFAPEAEFAAAVPPTSETRRIMSAYLGRMNPEWIDGDHVAMLLESNTAYGQTAAKYASERDDPFEKASVFRFPLHVSQLRSNAAASPASNVTLLPTAAVPLNMRETTPPTDQIPALRPQLTSSVVESTVDTILDAIRHERLTAVGIQATDDRDVLFLAREVKRAAPDVQLFFLGAHALYLHPDYLPYLRGTLVASPYSLSLTTQAGLAQSKAREREPFQSMSAEGIFNATLLLLDADSTKLLDYCNPATPGETCMPYVTISVIGEDGFWPLPAVETTNRVITNGRSYAHEANATHRFVARSLPPFPSHARVVIALLAVFVLTQVVIVLAIGHRLRRGLPAQHFLEWPVFRVLTPSLTYRSASTMHRFALLMCFIIVGLIAAWIAAVVVPFAMAPADPVVTGTVTVLAGGLALVPVLLLIFMPRRFQRVLRNWPAAATSQSRWLLMPILGLMFITIGAFIVYLSVLVSHRGSMSDLDLVLARLVGGGIVSPAPVTLCLFAGLYAGLLAAVRRSSLVGKGYTQLEERSSAFAMLNGGVPDGAPWRGNGGRLGDVLDMPAQNLPWTYVIAILLAGAIVASSVGRVSTVDGQPFAWFLAAGSATLLMLGLVNLAQGLAIWNTARRHLRALALSPIEGAFEQITHLVPWNFSLAPPRLMELRPVAQRADEIIHTHLGGLRLRGKRVGSSPIATLLERELDKHPHAAFTRSSAWTHLWKVSDAVVERLTTNNWRPATRAAAATLPTGLPVLLSLTAVPNADPETGRAMQVKMAALIEANPDSRDVPGRALTDDDATSIRRCQEFLALQFAFVLRDIISRTVSALFTAMLCLTLLTAAHLLYSFNPRSSLLTVDLLAVAVSSLASIWVLVSMERETVLSRLRNTTPGRVELSWPFVQRVAVYGVLPLLVVISSLFPEIGTSMFGWLEPLRKLSNF